MGAISGDVNSGPMDCVDPADLASRPTASRKSGDFAYVASLVEDPVGPYFFWQRGAAHAPASSVITPTSGGGQWLAFSVFGVPASPGAISGVAQAQLAAVANKGDPGFVDLLTKSSAIGAGNAILIQASASYIAGSDGNANFRVLVDDTEVVGGGAGSVIFTTLSQPASYAGIQVLVLLDTSIAHTVRFQWESPSTTPLEIDPTIPAGGVNSHQRQHASLTIMTLTAA